MQELIYKILFYFDNTANNFFLVVSAVVGVLSLIKEIHVFSAKNMDKGERKKKKIVWACLIVVSIIVASGTLIRKNLTEVPSVVGRTYENACNILSDCDLQYNLIANDGQYVTEQSIPAGTVVTQGTMIELTTDFIGNNADIRKLWEEQLNVEFGDLIVTFARTEIELVDSGKTVACFGPDIFDYEVKSAYLLDKESGVEYHDYVIEDGRMVFHDIPEGIKFNFYVLLDGFEEATTEVTLSSQNMLDGAYRFTWRLEDSNTAMRLPATFYVANGDTSKPEDVDYISNVELWIQWPYEEAWIGDYITDNKGSLEYAVFISNDTKIKVKILDPFNNNHDYECEVTLRKPVADEGINSDIVFLKEDGTCEVISESDYFFW